MKKLLACLLVAMASGCPNVTLDADEVEGGPIVEFDPARSLETKARFIPFPNDLARDPTGAKVLLGEQNCEAAASKATRENVLNQLDGFGAYQTAMQVTFTAEVDETSLANNVVMYQIAENGTSLATAVAVPVVVARVGTTARFTSAASCTQPELVNAVTFVPAVPLKQRSTYFVALLKGIKAKTGEEFAPSYTWGLVASNEEPVTLDDAGNIVSDRTPLDPADEEQRAQLQSLATLWRFHSAGLAVVDAMAGRPRTDVLVGFRFTTQTVQTPLDPMVATSPAAKLATVGLLQTQSVTGRFAQYSALCTNEGGVGNAQCFLKLALGGCQPLTTGCLPSHYATGNAICQSFGCAAVGDVLGAGLGQSIYQRPMMTNPLTGGAPIPGAWSHPINPEVQDSKALEVLAVIPAGTAPAAGWPVIVFGHGLGSSKEALLAIASQFAAQGFASVAIDTQSHGSRAVRTSNDVTLGCRGRCGTYDPNTGTTTFDSPAVECDTITDCTATPTALTRCGQAATMTAMAMFAPPSPTSAPQCYAPFLSSDLAVVRDGVRQTVLDNQRLVRALKTCGTSGCGALSVDATKILYAGQSLGSIIGTITVATTPDIKSALLNVGGVGWLDVLENTETLAIRCQLVNSLIDAGILMGDKWTGGTTGLCTSDAWKAQPGYATFSAIARWVLDPADPANFASRAAAKKILIQEVVGDTVVPNIATDRQAALMGMMTAGAGDVYLPPGSVAASAAITTMPTMSKFVKYTTMPADANTGFPGNIFEHASLLRPATGTGGALGTARLQTDAITFLVLNR